ncbi:MAG: hypothetical protein WBL93_06005 [Lutisporaceae bacterium]
MRLSNIKFPIVLIFVLVLVLTFTLSVYSDSNDGWKGYGLYNINDSKIEILQENISVELQNDKLKLAGEFVIRNMTNSKIRVILGMPISGIENMSMMENGYNIKWRKRSLEGLQNEFKVQDKLPQEDYWYVFYLDLNPEETRIVNLKLDAAQQLNEEGAYAVSYFGDRKLGFSNQVEKSTLYIKIANFEPYNILSLKGIDPSNIGKNGEILIETDEENMEEIGIRHEDLTAKAIDKLSKSSKSRPREIASAFIKKNYDRAVYLCDEYIKNPNDEKITNEQILFVKAESLRRQHQYENYLQLVETMDYSKLYPVELKNKIYLDRADVYLEEKEQDKFAGLLKEIYLLTDESSELLTAWMEDNGYKVPSDVDNEKPTEDNKDNTQISEKPTTLVVKYYNKIMDFPYTPVIIFLVGVLCGLFLRKATTRKKRKSSMYLYRR